MQLDPQLIWIAVGAAVVLVIAVLFMRGARKSRSAALRDRFGPEYQHALKEKGSRKQAERELVARAKEVRNYEIRPLSASDRERYVNDWHRVEAHFVERPTTAVVEADELIAEIMRHMGYPMGDFEKHAADLSVTHPRVVEHYRSGHAAISRTGASTEDLRQAMLHYRTLFDELTGGRDIAREIPVTREVRRDDEERDRPRV